MKPKIGQTVYCIYEDGIFVDKVAFIGTDSFIVESFQNDCTNRDSLEWEYGDYDIEWFTNLSKAKQSLIGRYKNENETMPRAIKECSNWYSLRY